MNHKLDEILYTVKKKECTLTKILKIVGVVAVLALIGYAV